MRRLRRECPWKREQTHRSLARYLQEETAETLEAIDTGDDCDHLREELGDLLLQVYFHAVIAEESGTFTIDDVARGISEKMHRRNPHVFGPTASRPTMTAAEVDAAVAADQDRREGRAARRTTASPRRCRHCCSPPRCSSASREPSPAARRRRLDADLGDRLLALVAEAMAAGSTRSRPSATPYAALPR